MKSHPYASKRRLTNICCLVVSLAFIKLVFVAYVMAGGELFEFTAEKELSPKASIMAREQRQNRQEVPSQNLSNTATESSLTGQNMNVGGRVQNTVPMLDSRVSFLPKGQASHTETKGQAMNSQKPYIQKGYSQKNDVNNASFGNQKAVTSSTLVVIPAVASRANLQNAQNSQNVNTLFAARITPASLQASVPSSTFTQASTQAFTQNNSIDVDIERSNRISSDAVLAQASAVTANIARAEVRANMLQNAFSENTNANPAVLDGIESQKSNYSSQNIQAQIPSVKTKQKSSFFSFVGKAHAAEEPYMRPDENINVAIPAPTVAPYSSPESLDYKQSELNRKEEELLALQQQMNARMDELNKIEGRVTSMVQGANSAEDGKFKHLIDTYTNMKPKKAAIALTTVDEAIAVRILNGMKSKKSGAIFSYMDPIQAARLSEAMTQLSM